MREAAVCAKGEHLHPERFELWIFDGNCRQFGRSDESEITGIKTEDHPFTFVIG
jgi:hypothetical protein